MRRARSAPLVLAALALALALAGCGSGGSSTATGASTTGATTTTGQGPAQTAAARAAVKRAARATEAAEDEAPKGASPTLRSIYRQFPAPKPASGEPSAVGAAIAAGEKACAGKTPLAVKEAFYAAARPDLEAEQAKMIARLGTYEAHAATDPSFVAGQLAADVYAATLEEEAAQAGYQGCIHALAQGLERRLAPAEK